MSLSCSEYTSEIRVQKIDMKQNSTDATTRITETFANNKVKKTELYFMTSTVVLEVRKLVCEESFILKVRKQNHFVYFLGNQSVLSKNIYRIISFCFEVFLVDK